MALLKTPEVVVVPLGAAAPARPDLPGLAAVGTKLARGLATALGAGGGAVAVTSDGSDTVAFAAWRTALPAHVAIARYADPAMKGGILLAAPATLVFALVDRLYGGDGIGNPAPRAVGVAERMVFDRLAALAAPAITAAWAGVIALAPALIDTVYTVEEVLPGPPDDAVVVQRFTATVASFGSAPIALVYPLAAVRGIAALQGRAEAIAQPADPVWQARLADAVMQSRLPVRTVIARPTLPLSRLIALKRGDVIPVTLPKRVPLTVAGRLLAHGTIGEANGRAALKIDTLEPGARLDD